MRDEFVISCQTNQPGSAVALYYQKTPRGSYRLAVSNSNGRIVKKEQTFLVSGVTLSDAGYYTCVATDERGYQRITMKKGRLLVSPGKQFGVGKQRLEISSKTKGMIFLGFDN